MGILGFLLQTFCVLDGTSIAQTAGMNFLAVPDHTESRGSEMVEPNQSAELPAAKTKGNETDKFSPDESLLDLDDAGTESIDTSKIRAPAIDPASIYETKRVVQELEEEREAERNSAVLEAKYYVGIFLLSGVIILSIFWAMFSPKKNRDSAKG